MEEKDSKVEKSSTAKTSRRNFLKGSAAIAGSALVGAAVKASPASAATQSNPKGWTDGKTLLKDVIARPDLWFYPGEELNPNEMRITLMGTG